MRTPKKAVAALWLALAAVSPVRADLNAGMQAMFDSLGVMGNYSSPTAFTAQNQGYLVGGGVSVRSPIRIITPVSVQRPSFSAGCAGIDIHLGSISFADLEGYKEFFQQLPNAALGFGLKVGLKSISETLSGAFDSLEEQINKYNIKAMNSCQAVQLAAEGASDAIEAINFERCKKRHREKMGDIRAEEYCRKNPKEAASGAASAPEGSRPITGNVVWKALDKVHGLSRDDKELIMSVFGTVVIRGEGQEPEHLPPTLPTFDSFFTGTPDVPNGLQTVARLKVYRCDESNECLKPSASSMVFKTFPLRVQERLRNITQQLVDKQPQSPLNIAFVNGTHYPVFRMLALATAAGDASMAEYFIKQYGDLIAIELALAYTDRLIAEADAIIGTAKHSLSTPEAQMLASIAERGRAFKAEGRHLERSLATKITSRQTLVADLESLQKSIYSNIPENVRRLLMAGR